jgi:hypothetical protein
MAFKYKVETVLKFDAAVYPTERNMMLYAKQYLVGNAAAAWDLFCVGYPEADYTWAALKELFSSRVARTKHQTDAAF